MLEIEYDSNEMTVSYEKGKICFLVTLNWWWDEYSRNDIYDREWITIDFDIVKAEWWIEDKPEIHEIKPTVLYKEWLAEEIDNMRHAEGFLFDDMREQLESNQERYYDYGI